MIRSKEIAELRSVYSYESTTSSESSWTLLCLWLQWRIYQIIKLRVRKFKKKWRRIVMADKKS